MNRALTQHIIETLKRHGVSEYCIAPGKRNAPLIEFLSDQKATYWNDERSAGFFALGRARSSGNPVVVITTSGTAVGELLPAMMEAYYTGVPLIALTADRPRAFRGTGSPQTCEQHGIFGVYTRYSIDIAAGERLDITSWSQREPIHINVCYDEPLLDDSENQEPIIVSERNEDSIDFTHVAERCDHFLKTSKFPLVIVGALPKESREFVVQFLEQLNAPVYLESLSGIREEPKLSHIRICDVEGLWERSAAAGYVIDSVLRIGGVPTLRLWRDLEDMEGKIQLLSVSDLPFSGCFWGDSFAVPLREFFAVYSPDVIFPDSSWVFENQEQYETLLDVLRDFPNSEQSLIQALSQTIQENALVYVGNSLPIRHWDAFACYDTPHANTFASRGVNGIDGQLSTFFGMCQLEEENWGIFGDLTTLYDFTAPWILPQLEARDVQIVVVNNGGGKIFDPMFRNPAFQNIHNHTFEPMAKMWGMNYIETQSIPQVPLGRNLIELLPDPKQTREFQNERERIHQC